HRVALDNSDHALAFCHQIVVHIDVHFRGYANDGCLTQRTQGVQTLADHWRYASGLHCVVSTTLGGFLDFLDHIHLLAIEGMSSTQLQSQFQSTVMYIHREDLLAAGDLRRHDRAQPHCATAINRNAGAEFRLETIEYSASAGLDTTAQRSHQREIHIRSEERRVGKE